MCCPASPIAISLVPPLAVVGNHCGLGSYSLAFGALVLFLSNVIAILVAGVIVFSAAGYRQEAIEQDPRLRKRAVWVVVAGLVALLIPLGFASYRVISTTAGPAPWRIRRRGGRPAPTGNSCRRR